MSDTPNMELDARAVEILTQVTTATLTTVLLKKGLRNLWIRGARPVRTGQPRLAGRVFTLRFVPAREDLATPESWSSPISTRAAIEAMPPGCIAVVDAMGVQDAASSATSCAPGWPSATSRRWSPTAWCATCTACSAPASTSGAAAPASVAGLTFVDWQRPIGCGGVAVFPGVVVVCDDDGAVLIPAAMLDHVLEHAPEQERLEGRIMDEVNKGAALPGLNPPNAENKARYEASKKQAGGKVTPMS